jgi:hypothetical protein
VSDADWFGGADAAPHAPRPVGEAFGHLRQKDEDAGGESEWFDGEPRSEGSADGAATEAGFDPPARLAAVRQQPARTNLPPAAVGTGEPEAAERPADTVGPEPAIAEPEAAEQLVGIIDSQPEAPKPEDGRVRLRALTGGLADLSDALAAIGVESVAVRTAPPAAPPAAPASAADFRVRCPDCGPQYVAIADMRFVETGDGAEANRYLFTCPACGARVRRPAGPELAEILKSSGVATLALRRGPGQAL